MSIKKKNILIIVRTMGLGGTENVVLQLCDILKQDVDKVVVCSGGGVHEKELKKRGIKHYKIPDISSRSIKDIVKIIYRIRYILREEEITIIHSHHRMAAFYAELVAGKSIIKIANVHNTFSDKKYLTRIAYKNTKLIAVGEMVKRNLMEYFQINARQINVIHNAVKDFDNKVCIIKEIQEEKENGNVLIGNIGRLSEQKGMSYFLDAVAMVNKIHPKVKFFIIGEGEEKNRLEEQTIRLKINDIVYFLGYRSDIQNLMSQLDFIVLSSLWEGLPLTPIEAYSVGKTVIGTAVDGTVEIIRDGIDGCLIEPRNAQAIAGKINYLIEHPEFRKEMEKEARKRYEAEFSFEQLKKSYLKVYEEL